jgi:hypothetical protein
MYFYLNQVIRWLKPNSNRCFEREQNLLPLFLSKGLSFEAKFSWIVIIYK